MKIFINRVLLIFFLFCIILNVGCSMRLADLTVASTRNVNLKEVDLDSLPQTKGIVGKDTKFTILFIPLGFPHVEDAIDDALDKGGGDVMIDAVLHSKWWYFLIIGQDSLEVKGTVVKTRGN